MTNFEIELLKNKVKFFRELQEDNEKEIKVQPINKDYFEGKSNAYQTAANCLEDLVELLIEEPTIS